MRIWCVVACVTGLALGAEPCGAVGINLGWDYCGPTAGSNKDFACDNNAGADSFVVSFVPPSGLPPIYLVGCRVRISTYGGAILPDWWRLHATGCRSSSLTVTVAPGASAGVCDTVPSVISGWTYFVSGSDAWQALLGVETGPMAPGVELTPGREYFLARVRLNHARTVDGDSCAGCSVRMLLDLPVVELSDSQGFPISMYNADRQQTITWQAGLVPVISRSWGQIKGLYRR
ncbi:MAG: hypothetical protein AAB215_06860 [Planctomycetota bacterium]